MKRFLLACLGILVAASVRASEPTAFGAMVLRAGSGAELEQAEAWVRSGGWSWLRATAPPARPLDVGWCRLIWPGARFEPSAVSPQIPTARLSTDPWEVYEASRRLAQGARGPTAYEIGNEPDLYFTRDLPDRMALTLKAAWWGIHDVQPEAVVLMPSLAARPGPYARGMLENNLASFTDGWNLHLYGWSQDFPEWIEEARRFLEGPSGCRKPVWVTEIGFAELPELPGPTPAVLLERQRAFFERVTFAAPFSGVSRQLAFVLGAYTEQGHDYGLYASDGAPRPALEVLARLTREMRQWAPRFELRRRSSGERIGWVLGAADVSREQAQGWWTLLFSPHRRSDFELPRVDGLPESRQPVSAPETSLDELVLRFPSGYGAVRLGLDGEHGETSARELRFTASAATNLFLRTPARRFDVADGEWIPVRRRRAALESRSAEPSRVLVSWAWDGDALRADKAAVAYRYRRGERLRLSVRLDNLGSEPVDGRWSVRLPSGWRAESSELEGAWQVPGGGTSWRSVVLRPDPDAGSESRRTLEVTWRGRDGRSDRAVMALAPEPSSADVLPTVAWPARWLALEPGTVWQEEALLDGGVRLRLEALRPGVTPGLLLTVPATVRLHPDDVLRLRVRSGLPEHAFRRRVELVTADRQVFRQGDDLLVGNGWETLELRVGDFTPAFWSRADSGRRSGPEEARYVRLGLFGMEAGGVVELGPLEWLRRR